MMATISGVLSEMLENLSSHKDGRAREVYFRSVCRDLAIRETVLSYEHEAEPHAPQLATPYTTQNFQLNPILI